MFNQKDDQNLKDLTKEELEELMKVLGKKMALLLAASSMPKETKEAWLALLPKMSFEQIERLMKVLENELESKISPELEKLNKELLILKDKFDQKKKNLHKQTIEKLEELEKEIK